MPDPRLESSRIASLDQFRGYTVLGMFLVNFAGPYAAVKAALPTLAHHHTYCSYADTIMPQFFLAVGFAYRLTFLKRWEARGPRAAYGHAARRGLALLVLGFVVHHLDGRYETWARIEEAGLRGFLRDSFQRNFFQTLTHIGLTTLWLLPVIGARPSVRALHAAGSAVLFHLLSEGGYYEWVTRRPGIDGGPLGFLTWTIPASVGTLACDAMAGRVRPPVGRLLGGGALLMLTGYGLSCLAPTADGPGWTFRFVEPPFVSPAGPVTVWTMSQRAGSVSYQTFGSGFALAVLALFALACDAGRARVGLLRTLGTNALVGYVLHDLVNEAVKPLVPKDAPLWYVFAGFGASLGVCYLVLRFLEKQRVYVKL